MPRKIQIKFVSKVKGIADLFPVIKASEYKRKWVNEVIKDYKDNHKESQHIMRCPGIFSLLNEGYIFTTWHDVIIKTKKGVQGFSWQIPMSRDNKEIFFVPEIIETQTEDITKWFPKKEGQTDTFIKLNSPINVIAPKGIRLLVSPIPYPEQFDFECVSGILNPLDSTEINIQLKWFKEDGEVLIKAGTPIAHLIPLYNTDEKIEIVNRDANEKELAFIDKSTKLQILTFGLHKYRQKIKNMYKQYFYN